MSNDYTFCCDYIDIDNTLSLFEEIDENLKNVKQP